MSLKRLLDAMSKVKDIEAHPDVIKRLHQKGVIDANAIDKGKAAPDSYDNISEIHDETHLPLDAKLSHNLRGYSSFNPAEDEEEYLKGEAALFKLINDTANSMKFPSQSEINFLSHDIKAQNVTPRLLENPTELSKPLYVIREHHKYLNPRRKGSYDPKEAVGGTTDSEKLQSSTFIDVHEAAAKHAAKIDSLANMESFGAYSYADAARDTMKNMETDKFLNRDEVYRFDKGDNIYSPKELADGQELLATKDAFLKAKAAGRSMGLREYLTKYLDGSAPFAVGGMASALGLVAPEEAEAAGVPPISKGSIDVPKSDTLQDIANLMSDFETPIGKPFQGAADYINKVNYGDDIGVLDRIGAVPDPTDVSTIIDNTVVPMFEEMRVKFTGSGN